MNIRFLGQLLSRRSPSSPPVRILVRWWSQKLISGDKTEAAVTQHLALMAGFVDQIFARHNRRPVCILQTRPFHRNNILLSWGNLEATELVMRHWKDYPGLANVMLSVGVDDLLPSAEEDEVTDEQTQLFRESISDFLLVQTDALMSPPTYLPGPFWEAWEAWKSDTGWVKMRR